MKFYVIENKDNKILSWDDIVGEDYFDHYNPRGLSRFQIFTNYTKALYKNKKFKDTKIIELSLFHPCALHCYNVSIKSAIYDEIRGILSKAYQDCKSPKEMLDKCFNELEQIQEDE